MSKIKKYSKVEATAWVSAFCSLFGKGVDSVKETIKNRFENEKTGENFDLQQKAFFLVAAKYCFNGKTAISKETIEPIKLFFQENGTLKELQTELGIDVLGKAESTDVDS